MVVLTPQTEDGTLLTMPLTTRRGPGRPPAAKADETRKRILQAAREVFSERGYDGATFQAIAVRADLTRPAINHYFPSKQVLYREVVKQTFEYVVTTGLEKAAQIPTLQGRLSQIIGYSIEIDRLHPSSTAFLVTAFMEAQRHPELSESDSDAVVTTREFLVAAVGDAIERGELASDVEADSLVETLLVMLVGLGFYLGYVGSYQGMDSLAEPFLRLMSGTLWQSRG